MAVTDETKTENSNLPFFLDPNTKGGVLVLMTALFLVTWLGYQFIVNVLGYDEIDAGIGVGMGFTVISTLAWMSTYLFRVVTKDMTYVRVVGLPFLLVTASSNSSLSSSFQQAKQLKDYENAVIAKRLEELDDDEVQALVEEVTKDSF
jgi:hypothetical protein